MLESRENIFTNASDVFQLSPETVSILVRIFSFLLKSEEESFCWKSLEQIFLWEEQDVLLVAIRLLIVQRVERVQRAL